MLGMDFAQPLNHALDAESLVNQHDFLVRLLTNLPFFFFLLTLLPGLGGMLGAKSAPRRRPSA